MPENQQQVNTNLQGQIDELTKQISELKNKPETSVFNQFKDIDFKPFLKVGKLFANLNILTATPTYSGQEGEIVLTDDGSLKQLCSYIDGAWKCIEYGNHSNVRAYLSADQTVLTSAVDKIKFDTESWDVNSDFDATTNYRFTPTTAGYYLVHCKIYDNNANNSFQLKIYKNGAEYSSTRNLTTGYTWEITDVVYLNGTTDYVEMFMDAFAANKNIDSGSAASVLNIFKII